MGLGVLQLQPPACILVTWKLARDQVWTNGKDNRKDFAVSCLLIVVLVLDNLQRDET